MLNATLTATLATGAVVAVAPNVINAEAVPTFKDVKETDYFYDAVHHLVARGLINGYEDGTFRPNEVVTRGQVAELMANILELDTENVKNPGFKDVSPTDTYYGAVASLVEAGVFSKGETFNPEGKITRAELAKVLVRSFQLIEKPYIDAFTDVTENSWYGRYVQALVDKNITLGKSAQSFAPNDVVSRGELVTFIYRSEKAKPEFVLNLMHTNDNHSHLDQVAKKATAIKQVREAKPNSLLVNAGDFLTGTLYYNVFDGQADLYFMNLLGYDIATFGNHEFDQGSSPEGHQALVDFIKGSEFPFVSSNIDFSQDSKFTGLFSDLISSDPENGKIYQGIVKEINGEKVGFFGLTTVETPAISSPENVTFKDYIEAAKKAVKAFEELGVNKIVALSHLGFDDNPAVDNDLTLAKEVDGIDIIIGGHTHTKLEKPVVINENGSTTIIVQAYQYNEFLGTLDVEFDKDGKIVGYAGELISITNQTADAEVGEILKEYASELEIVKNSPIGAEALVELENPRLGDSNNTKGISVRSNETPLGNLITDGMLMKAREFNPEIIMALQNGGGIRAAIDKGEITIGEVQTVLPFGNTLAIIQLTGAELKQAFEISLKEYPKENGGFLHISGGKLQFDSTKPVGERVVSLSYLKDDGTYVEVEDDKTYYIATNFFTAKGGDSFTVFEKAYEEGRVTDLGLADWENFRDYLISLGTVEPKVEGRIVDISVTE